MAVENMKYELEIDFAKAQKQVDSFFSKFEKRFQKTEGEMAGGIAGATRRRAKVQQSEEDRLQRNRVHNAKQTARIEQYAAEQSAREEIRQKKARASRLQSMDDAVDARITYNRKGQFATLRQSFKDEADAETRKEKERRSRIDRWNRFDVDDEKFKEQKLAKVRTDADSERKRKDSVNNLARTASLNADAVSNRAKILKSDDELYQKALQARRQFETNKQKIIDTSAGKSKQVVNAEIQTELASYRGKIGNYRGQFSERRNASMARSRRFGKASMMAFQGQQMIEDYSYAGWRGVSNNLAFMGSMMGGVAGLAVVGGVAAKGLWDVAKAMMGVRDEAEAMSERADRAHKSLDKFAEQRQSINQQNASFRTPRNRGEWNDKVRRADDEITALLRRDDFSLHRNDLGVLSGLRQFADTNTNWTSGAYTPGGKAMEAAWKAARGRLSDPNVLPDKYWGDNVGNNFSALQDAIDKTESSLHSGQVAKDVKIGDKRRDLANLKSSLSSIDAMERIGLDVDRFKGTDDFDLKSSALSAYRGKFARSLNKEFEDEAEQHSAAIANVDRYKNADLTPNLKEQEFQRKGIEDQWARTRQNFEEERKAEDDRLAALDKVYEKNEKILDGLKEQVTSEEKIVEKLKERREALESGKYSQGRNYEQTMLKDAMGRWTPAIRKSGSNARSISVVV